MCLTYYLFVTVRFQPGVIGDNFFRHLKDELVGTPFTNDLLHFIDTFLSFAFSLMAVTNHHSYRCVRVLFHGAWYISLACVIFFFLQEGFL